MDTTFSLGPPAIPLEIPLFPKGKIVSVFNPYLEYPNPNSYPVGIDKNNFPSKNNPFSVYKKVL